jgi:hypothetical protein
MIKLEGQLFRKLAGCRSQRFWDLKICYIGADHVRMGAVLRWYLLSTSNKWHRVYNSTVASSFVRRWKDRSKSSCSAASAPCCPTFKVDIIWSHLIKSRKNITRALYFLRPEVLNGRHFNPLRQPWKKSVSASGLEVMFQGMSSYKCRGIRTVEVHAVMWCDVLQAATDLWAMNSAILLTSVLLAGAIIMLSVSHAVESAPLSR